MKRKHTRVIAEIVFQLMLTFILFVFYSYNEDGRLTASGYKLAYFLNYALAAMIINYILAPKLYSKGKVGWFMISFVSLIGIVILIDELVIEQIYFPRSRGTYFPGLPITLFEVLPIIFLFVGLKFTWDFYRKQREIEVLKGLVKDSELQFLKSQINPHFLFNNLNNLYVHAMDNSLETPNIIIELSSVLRYMLYDCKEKFTPLEQEILHLRNYTALNKLQIGDRGIITFQAGPVRNEYEIAPLILVVFVENAFKHSTGSQSENIHIRIVIEVTKDGWLHFYCKNSYMEKSNMDRLDRGIGLENVKKRLELLYANAHSLKISQNGKSYEVRLSMQLKKSNL